MKHVTQMPNNPPVKKVPYSPSSEEWAILASDTRDIEPTNMASKV